jgi:cytochrome c-type biogenesis protein CcmE
MEENGKEKNKPKKMGKKQKQLLIGIIAAVIIIIAVVIAFSAMNPPSPYKEVADVLEDSSQYTGDEVEVVGNVGEIIQPSNDTLEIRFELIDRDNPDKTIWVDTLTQPEGFVTGKDVVVTGTMQMEDGNYIIKAKDIKVGCPSKYE